MSRVILLTALQLSAHWLSVSKRAKKLEDHLSVGDRMMAEKAKMLSGSQACTQRKGRQPTLDAWPWAGEVLIFISDRPVRSSGSKLLFGRLFIVSNLRIRLVQTILWE